MSSGCSANSCDFGALTRVGDCMSFSKQVSLEAFFFLKMVLMNKIIWYLSFFSLHISFNVIPSRPFYVVTDGKILSLFMAV